MGKVFWFDCETTGLDAEACAIIQLAALIEID
jgi:oligoribonuclease (3'-5' exoribonuclease)